MTVATKTLHGQWLKANGDPESGSVTYRTYVSTRLPDDNVIVSPSTFSAVMVNGEVTIPNVPVNNDPQADPSYSVYDEEVSFTDGRRTLRQVFIDIAGPSVIEVADLPYAQPYQHYVNYATLDATGNVPLSQLRNAPTIASTSYVHEQATPSSQWIVTHNLGSYVSLTVWDSSGGVIVPDAEFVSVNAVSLTFPTATTGRVVCI